MPSQRALERCARLAAEVLNDDDHAALIGLPAALAALLQTYAPAVRFTLVEQAMRECGSITVYLAGGQVAPDGSLASVPGALALAEHARQAGVPFYALAPAGPIANSQLDGEIVPAALIAAILTSRGIYRPEMITRHTSDGDAPLDIITLRSP